MTSLTQTLTRSTTRTLPHHLRSLIPFSTRSTTTSSSRSKPKPYPPSPPPLQPPPDLPTPTASELPPPSPENEKVEMVFNRPRPTEIPFQRKVANTVNLIGTVLSPVKFRASSDGKCWAVTMISQQQFSDSSPLRIPVIFEDDLAHTAACHLKEKDNIYVDGELSVDPLPVKLEDDLPDLQVMVRNVSFVDGVPELKSRVWHRKNELKTAQSDSADVSSTPNADVGSQENDSGTEIQKDKPASPWDLWNDLVKNPKGWFDYRNDKVTGAVNPKYPDFKKVEGGQPLWLTNVPKWISPKLEGLEFSMPAPKQKKEEGGFSTPFYKKTAGPPFYKKAASSAPTYKKPFASSKAASNTGSESWKDVLENPNKWWDNRSGKTNAKAPDFKHKDTGEALWLDRAPEWVLLKLPQPKKGGSFGDKRETWMS